MMSSCREIHIVGHGVGGAVALLHFLDLENVAAHLHTFGAPRSLQGIGLEIYNFLLGNMSRCERANGWSNGCDLRAAAAAAVVGLNHLFSGRLGSWWKGRELPLPRTRLFKSN